MAAAGLLPIVLSCKCRGWRKDDGTSYEADSEFQKVRKDILERDNYSCRFCGFTCKPHVVKPPDTSAKGDNYYMQVHHRDDDHHNNKPSNLITACLTCHACQHIGLHGSREEAILIWLPEMTQATLNHVLRTIQVAQRYSETIGDRPDLKKGAAEIASVADAVFARLKARSLEAQQRYKTSSPADLANALLQMPTDAYVKRAKTLAPLRLLHLGKVANEDSPDIMPRMVDTWMMGTGPYAALKPTAWASFLRALPVG